MRRFFVLLRNEMKLSIRDMNMIIFAVLMPLVILAMREFISRIVSSCGGTVM